MIGMSSFDPQGYGPEFGQVLQIDRRRALDGGVAETTQFDTLAAMSVESVFGHVTLADDEMARCCLSGVWLLCDYLDESHTISQGIPSSSGSFWHGIMHRREGDFSNAKYWFRKVGDHPVFEKLAAAAGQSEWDPFAFVDACQQAVRGQGDAERCRQLQQAEWEALFDFCYQEAVGA